MKWRRELELIWRGDLEADCILRAGEWLAHVGRTDDKRWLIMRREGEKFFCASDLDGPTARAIAEAIIRAAVVTEGLELSDGVWRKAEQMAYELSWLTRRKEEEIGRGYVDKCSRNLVEEFNDLRLQRQKANESAYAPLTLAQYIEDWGRERLTKGVHECGRHD